MQAHFRHGVDDSGSAKTILIVEAPADWSGTTRLGALPGSAGPVLPFLMYPLAEVGGVRRDSLEPATF